MSGVLDRCKRGLNKFLLMRVINICTKNQGVFFTNSQFNWFLGPCSPGRIPLFALF